MLEVRTAFFKKKQPLINSTAIIWSSKSLRKKEKIRPKRWQGCIKHVGSDGIVKNAGNSRLRDTKKQHGRKSEGLLPNL